MKESIHCNLSQNINLKHRETFFILTSNRKISNDNEEQILFNHKSSLETTLNLIKNLQLEYLSKRIKKDKIKTIKKTLNSFRNNINLILEEKNKKLSYIKSKNEISKKKIQNLIFLSSNLRNLDKIKYNINEESNKIYSLISENNQLKLLNFQIRNEIEKTQFLIEQKAEIIGYIKSVPFFYEESKKIFCNNNYETIKKITSLLSNEIREIRKEFIETVKAKMEIDMEINNATLQIDYIKDNIENYKLKGCKKYIETKDIIQEDSNEYIKTLKTNQSKRNSLSSINNTKLVQKMNIINSKNKYNIQKKEKIIKDKLKKNNILFTDKINKNILNDINNKSVNNYLNMNINVNINLNNNNFMQETFNSSLDSNITDEENEKNEQYEMNLNDNNKIIITPITTNENISTVNNKSDNFDIKDN